MVGIDYNNGMDTLGSRIRFARRAKKLTQQDLADALEINRVNVSTWESDQTKPETSRIPILADLLGVTEGWLLRRSGDDPTPATKTAKIITPTLDIVPGSQLLGTGMMPVFAAAQGGDGHVIVTFDAVDHVKRPAELENVRGGYGLLIVSDSMVPAFRPGDMALVNPHLPPARDKNVILYHTPPHGGDVEAIVKQLNGWNDREWHLQQWNPILEFSEFRQEWPICHRVVGRYDAR
jgi:transcriptional regulator with XRE-family HTH domain